MCKMLKWNADKYIYKVMGFTLEALGCGSLALMPSSKQSRSLMLVLVSVFWGKMIKKEEKTG